jgi:predicted PurR-regulated permease PerM
MKRHPSLFQQRTLWNAATGVAILVLGSLVVGFIWLLGKVFGVLQPVLIPLIVAGIIAYVFDPVVRLFQARGLSRLWSVITIYFLILLTAILLVAAVLPGIQRSQKGIRKLFSSKPAASEMTGAAISQDPAVHLVPALTRSLHYLRLNHKEDPIGWLLTEVDDAGAPQAMPDELLSPYSAEIYSKSRVGRLFTENIDVILNTGRSWLSAGSSKVFGFFGLLLGMIMVPVYLFFFLKDSASITTHWHDYVPLKASRFKTSLVETLEEINGYLVSFFRGQVLVAVIDGILVGVALTIFGLPYGFLIGIFMAILGIIPYIGNILCMVPACIIAYLHSQTPDFGMTPWAYIGCVLAIFVVVQQINSLLTAPKIVGDSVGLHPMTVIFSMLFWSLILGGFVGALLAVPLSAAVKVLFRRFIWERQVRELPNSSAVSDIAETEPISSAAR